MQKNPTVSLDYLLYWKEEYLRFEALLVLVPSLVSSD